MTRRKRLVVVGHGMVGHRFVQAAIERGPVSYTHLTLPTIYSV